MKPGNTELVELNNIKSLYNLAEDVHLYAKVEGTNPSGSIKDRAVYNMLQEYKKSHILKKNSLIVEATSGNTGISLAYYSKDFNYRVIIVMPESASLERRKMIQELGGELCLVNGGMKECNEKALEIVQTNENAFIFDQFNNPNNPMAHYKTTGPEILEQLPGVSAVFAGVGTGGTISGLGKFFKENKPNTRIIGVEPLESPLLTQGFANKHLIQGIGANFIPNTYLKEYVDEVVDVLEYSSIAMARDIMKYENIFVGISSGAALLGAIKYIQRKGIIKGNFVIIFPDKGDRYSW